MSAEIIYRSDFDVILIDTMGEDARVCQAAQVSLKGRAALESGESDRLIRFLMNSGHGTPFEQCEMVWMISQPIKSWREHYRHRTGHYSDTNYNEQSGRWMQLEPVFYVPPLERPSIKVEGSRTGDYSYRQPLHDQELAAYHSHAQRLKTSQRMAYEEYEASIEAGLALEVARDFLPVTIYSSAWVKMNLRGVMNFLHLRAAETCMWELRQVAYAMERDFAEKFPLVHAAWNDNGRVAP